MGDAIDGLFCSAWKSEKEKTRTKTRCYPYDDKFVSKPLGKNNDLFAMPPLFDVVSDKLCDADFVIKKKRPRKLQRAQCNVWLSKLRDAGRPSGQSPNASSVSFPKGGATLFID